MTIYCTYNQICLGEWVSTEASRALSASVIARELHGALAEMAMGKASGPNGVIIEFFKEYWDTIHEDYLAMVNAAINTKVFPPGVNKGLISLIHKGECGEQLTNWCLITLLNAAYKLFAKMLQWRLQPVLVEIISIDQLAFLPRRLILDNILMTHETLSGPSTRINPLSFSNSTFQRPMT